MIISAWPKSFIRDADLATLLSKTDDARYSIVKRALKSGLLIRVRRGLYLIASKIKQAIPDEFELALLIYGPSIVSRESALSYHGWIPEAVYTLTSVSFGKSKEFNTPLGVFSYIHVPQNVFYNGVERMTDEDENIFLMATPIKALADYVYVHKKDWSGLKPATESLRIEPEEFESVTLGDIELLIDNYTSRRVQKFIKGLKKDLKL